MCKLQVRILRYCPLFPACFLYYKTLLQEYVQRDGDKHIVYHLLSESGPDHAKTFLMEVEINGVTYEAGSGKSKKIAEQHAAQLTLEKLMADK